MEIGKIKADNTGVWPQNIPEVIQTPKKSIRLEITSTHKYNTRSSINRGNNMTAFKNVPKMFQVDATEKIKTHIGTD